MGQNLASQHSHLYLASHVPYAIPLKTSFNFTHTSDKDGKIYSLKLDLYEVSDEDYRKSLSTKGFYCRSCANLYRIDETIDKDHEDDDIINRAGNSAQQLIVQYSHVYGPCSGNNQVFRRNLMSGVEGLMVQQRHHVNFLVLAKDDLVQLL